MVHEHFIIFINPPGIIEQLLEIAGVLLNHLCYLLQLGKLVAIVVLEHALRTDQLMTHPAKVLNLLVLMFKAEYARHVSEF